jgi:hypothetical protein
MTLLSLPGHYSNLVTLLSSAFGFMGPTVRGRSRRGTLKKNTKAAKRTVRADEKGGGKNS